ncbi:hypothetical protein H310_01873 [Aphanomyces invadans]|uniref:Uncharacterized protein n=1 Tax=Aphanomyces invadans TaxID=157072 RepID=A0A024UNY2_9STRA|nr:hypothetical protein H310_01873 [Aphanomyces invadans]ETW07333.1 hypothetical protein H310_01873 [Aphanomyces invadans]|eukprot:XP_008863426.1 hypothetical protein H310_01873 [Aphanomyces invadans]
MAVGTSIMENAADFVEYVSRSTFRIGALAAVQVAVFVFVQVFLATAVYRPAVERDPSTMILAIPDARYGYGTQDLFELYMWMGPAVRRWYIYFELVDLFVFIPTCSATVSFLRLLMPFNVDAPFLTLLLLLVHRRLGRHEPLIIYLPFVAAIFDAFENAAHIYTAHTFESLESVQKETWILAAHVGSISNIFKWGAIGAVFVLLCWNFGKTTIHAGLDNTDPSKKSD